MIYFSSTSSQRKKYQQCVRKAWLADKSFKDWVVFIEDKNKVKCKFCACVIAAKKSRLEEHYKSKKHLQNSTPFTSVKQKVIDFEKEKFSDKIKIAEARISMYVAKHTSINAVDHLSYIVNHNLGDNETASKIKLGRSKCSAIIKNVLAPHFINDLIDDIDNGFYSLLVDESTDMSTVKFLGITIVYYSKKEMKLINTFLKLQELEEHNAQGIVGAIKKVLMEFKLEMEKMVGIGTDNAAVMVGAHNGVYAQLKKDIPRLVHIPCICHSLQLAVSEASAKCLPRNLDFMLSETYAWFSRSSTRQNFYKSIYSVLNEGKSPLKIVRACDTRWLSIEPAIVRVLDQWIELKTHFDIVRISEKCYTAEILSQMFKDDTNHAYFLFLKPVLSEVQRVNKHFESSIADITMMLDDIYLLLSSILNKIVVKRPNFDYVNSSIRDSLLPLPYLGYEFEEKIKAMKMDKNFTLEQEKTIRHRCIEFLIELSQSIRQRLPQNIKILRKTKILSVENALKVIKEPLIPLAQEMKIAQDLIGKIQNQWENLHLVCWKKKENSLSFWSEVSSYKDSGGDNPYYELCMFAWSILVLPLSNAEVERVFSQMNFFKNKLRNKMQTKMINSLLIIRAALQRNNKCCCNIEVNKEMIKNIGTLKAYDDEATTTILSDEIEASEIMVSLFSEVE